MSTRVLELGVKPAEVVAHAIEIGRESAKLVAVCDVDVA